MSTPREDAIGESIIDFDSVLSSVLLTALREGKAYTAAHAASWSWGAALNAIRKEVGTPLPSWTSFREAFVKQQLSRRRNEPVSVAKLHSIRAFNVASALLRRDVASLSAEERRLASHPDLSGWFSQCDGLFSPPRAPVAGHGERLTFEARYTWSRNPRAGAPAGLGSQTMPMEISPIPSKDTEVALLLARPDGGRLEVRRHAGRLLRPLLAPGSWTPATLSQFADAMETGVAWRDRPFPVIDLPDISIRGPDGVFGPLLNVDDVAIEIDATHAADRMRIEARATAVRDACARLVVIDEAVWIETPPPTAFILDHENGDFRVCWRLGDLMECEPQTTFGVLEKASSLKFDPRNQRTLCIEWPLGAAALLRTLVPLLSRFPEPPADTSEECAWGPDGAPWREGVDSETLANACALILSSATIGRSTHLLAKSLDQAQSALLAKDYESARTAVRTAMERADAYDLARRNDSGGAVGTVANRIRAIAAATQEFRDAIMTAFPEPAIDDAEAMDGAFAP